MPILMTPSEILGSASFPCSSWVPALAEAPFGLIMALPQFHHGFHRWQNGFDWQSSQVERRTKHPNQTSNTKIAEGRKFGGFDKI